MKDLRSYCRSQYVRLMNVLLSVDRYAKLRKTYSDEVSIGYFRLLQARSNRTSSINAVENLRFDIDATVTIDKCNDDVDELHNKTDNFDSIYLFSAMPPPTLKAAQRNFQNAIELAQLLLNETEAIQSSIIALEGSRNDETTD